MVVVGRSRKKSGRCCCAVRLLRCGYVDLEEDIAHKIPRYGKTKRIISLHNFEFTPAELEDVHERLAKLDADIVKIATMANSFADTIRMLRLVQHAKTPTIAICMGDLGMVTRILSLRYGAPFTYTAMDGERKIAPGMIPWKTMRELYRPETITEKTKLFGVVADPVAHSLSPLLHNTAFAADNLDCRYLPFRIPPDDLKLFAAWCQETGIGGLSVTIPHKEAMLDYIQQAEQAVNGIGALNTVVFRDGEAAGYNTDYRAAMELILDRVGGDSPDVLKGRGVLILGAGVCIAGYCIRIATAWCASGHLQSHTRSSRQACSGRGWSILAMERAL